MDVGAARRPRVLVVSDVRLYREGLSASLAREGGLEVVGAVAGADALSRLAAEAPDAVLIDASLADGLDLARRIRQAAAQVRIVGFGIGGGDAGMVACAEAGLAGFVERESSVAELAEAVRRALRGEVRCSPRLAALLFDRLADLSGARATRPGPEALTRREREIAALIEHGLSNKQIAVQLRIGPATVKNHVHNILEKLNVRRRGAVIARLREAPETRA